MTENLCDVDGCIQDEEEPTFKRRFAYDDGTYDEPEELHLCVLHQAGMQALGILTKDLGSDWLMELGMDTYKLLLRDLGRMMQEQEA